MLLPSLLDDDDVVAALLLFKDGAAGFGTTRLRRRRRCRRRCCCAVFVIAVRLQLDAERWAVCSLRKKMEKFSSAKSIKMLNSTSCCKNKGFMFDSCCSFSLLSVYILSFALIVALPRALIRPAVLSLARCLFVFLCVTLPLANALSYISRY